MGRFSAQAALQNEQKDKKKGPHHSMKHFIYKQDVSPLKLAASSASVNPFP